MRPRRKRKLTKYGEGHLHWIEESQLHKALMKSLKETSSRNALEEDEGSNQSLASKTSMASSSREEAISKPTISGTSKTGKATSSKVLLESSPNDEVAVKKLRKLRFRDSASQNSSSDGTSSHATMMQPRNSDSSSKESNPISRTSSQMSDFKETDNSDCVASPPHNVKPMAQRKFASSSTQSARNGSRNEKKFRKCNRSNLEEKCEPISDNPLPKTRDFVNYICFRNTPFHFELDDGT